MNAAMSCAAREGFHKTTMAHVVAESGLSAGAVYGYFSSKAELIQAIASRAVEMIAGTLHDVAERPGPVTVPEAFTAVLERVDRNVTETGGALPRVALHARAEAGRDTQVADIVRRNLALVHEVWVSVLDRAAADGTIPAGLDHGTGRSRTHQPPPRLEHAVRPPRRPAAGPPTARGAVRRQGAVR